MDKIDFKKTYKDLYMPGAEAFSEVIVPPLQYLMIDGQGNPNTAPQYTAAVEALYGLAYTLKFMSKRTLSKDYAVPPLEGLWWADNPQDFVDRNKEAWQWTMMILQPDWISQELFDQARMTLRDKKNSPALPKVRLQTYDEGYSVHIMHIGSYDDEAPILHTLHTEYLPSHGLTFNGKHHEIYLSDPRKTTAAKLKTVLRQPVTRIQQ